MDKWDKRFIEMAKVVGSWSSCYQDNRQIGAVIVREKRILTTGYNGAPSGIKSCKERQTCLRRDLNIESIKKVIYNEGYPDDFSMKIFNEAGVEVIKYEEN